MIPPDDRIFGFRVIEQLGSGARTTILRVVDVRGKHHALKHLLVRSGSDRRSLLQMRHEYAVSRQLSHPGIRRIHRLRVRRAPLRVVEAALLMDLVEGASFDQCEPSTVSNSVDPMLDIASALASMHRTGWVHGDVKPTNLVLSPDGAVLIDLGQAATVGSKKERVQGTPGFMAPEQVFRDRITQRTDLFGFGATLYWALTGTPIPTVIKHGASEHAALAGRTLFKPKAPTPLAEIRDDVPHELSDLVARCVAYEPKNRPDGFADILGTLARFGSRRT